jgi:hypothetical protein
MSCLHEYAELPVDEMSMLDDIQCHVAQLLSSMDLDVSYPKVNLFDHVPKNYKNFLSFLSKLQQEALTQYMSCIEHGIVAIEGCVASAKTLFGILTMLMSIAEPDKHGNKKRGLWTSETNEAVNDAARKIEEMGNRLDLDLKIIRIVGLSSEAQSFEDHLNPRQHPEHFRAAPEQVEDFMFLAQRMLNLQGHRFEDDRRKGDKRKDPRIRNLSLSEAMWEELQANLTTDLLYHKLWDYLRELANEPDTQDVTREQINPLINLVMSNTRAKADIEVVTISGALFPKFRTGCRDAYAVVVLDEAAKTVHQHFCALVGAFRPSMFYMVLGDCAQGLPCSITEHIESAFINSFYKTGTYSTLARLKDGCFPICSLTEQFRMHTRSLTPFISRQHYHGVMTDGTLGLPDPPELGFAREFMAQEFGVKDTWVVVKVEGSRSQVEENGTSLVNQGHQIIIDEYVQKLRNALDASELDFDKEAFTTKLLSPYKAQVNVVRNNLNRVYESGDRRFASLTGKVAQGIEADCVILHIPNSKTWTHFVNEKRDLLVLLTRQRYILIVIISAACLLPASYGLNSKLKLCKSAKAGNLLQFVEFAAMKGNIKTVKSPDTRPCNFCSEIGHRHSECPHKQKCYNCGSTEHTGKVDDPCPLPEVLEKPKPYFGGTCKQCSKVGHGAADCPLGFTGSCNQCGQQGHRKADYPLPFCKTW